MRSLKTPLVFLKHRSFRMSDFSFLPFGDEYFMRCALREAEQAYAVGEVPIGAVLVAGDQIVGKGYNQTETLQDVTAHAEMLAITSAQNTLGSKVLPECTLYVTVEPCVMCAGAIRWSRIGRLVWGCDEPKVGFSTVSASILHPKTTITSGILADEAAELMRSFFAARR